MESFRYVIVGGGMTAQAAAKGIREIDAGGPICMIGSETDPPYKRPPLTKALWKGKPEDSIWLKIDDPGVSMKLGRRVTSLDVGQKRAVDDHGDEYAFEKLLLATGGDPKRLQLGSEEIIHFRYLADYRRLRQLCENGNDFAVIGGGFIGSEIAAALAMNGKRVTMLFPDTGIGARVYPRELSNFVVDYFRERGVEVCSGDVPVSVESRGDRHTVRTQTGRERIVDGVLAGIGIAPNVELAAQAGLAMENGVVVDELCRSSSPDVYAAGDVAAFHNPALGVRMRVEHEDNALTMGAAAGRSMAGSEKAYDHLPYFYSDLFDLGYEAVGELDISRCETYADWKEPFKEGVIYYLREGRVRGVLLWNVWDKVPAARELIAAPGPFRPEDLKARIA